MSALKFSALVRTIVAEATIYFLAMIVAQTYVQLSLNLMQVCFFVLLRVVVIVDSNVTGHCSTTFVSVSVPPNWEIAFRGLTFSTFRVKVHMACTLTLC
jgi:hypothetical protein